MNDTALLAAAMMIGLFALIVGSFVRAMLPPRQRPRLRVVRGSGTHRVAPVHVVVRRRPKRARLRTGGPVATLDAATRLPASRAR